MITPEPEDVRFALVTGLVIGALVGALVGYCIRKTRKPPMARSTHFSNPGKVSNWKRPPNAR